MPLRLSRVHRRRSEPQFHESGVSNLNSPTWPSEKIALVQRLALFSDVPPATCFSIISAAYERRLWHRQTIFSEGDPAQQVLMLLSGCVKITLLGLSGREVILRLIGTGELVGDIIQLSANCKHFSTAKAVQSSLALVWDVTVFENLLDRFPTFRRNMVRGLEDRLRETEQRFREVSTENVEPRVSSELIRLSNRFGCSENGHKEIHLTRVELAQLTGTTQSTISRLLSRWQRLGIVSIHREAVRVCNSVALAQLTLNE